MAVQMARMIMNDIYREMKQHKTLPSKTMTAERRKEVLLRGLFTGSSPPIVTGPDGL